MNKAGETFLYISGGIFTSGLVEFITKGIGFLAAGIIGGIGGWIAQKFIIPYLNQLYHKYFPATND